MCVAGQLMTRRSVASLLFLLTSVWAGAARAQTAGPPDALRTQSLDVSDNLYLVSGGGGNSLMMTGDHGVVLVDTKLAGYGKTLVDIAASISDQPVTTAIYTHAHPDHTGSSRELPTLSQIVAHENTKAIMERMDAFKGAGARFLPGTTFRETMTLGEGRDRINLYYFGAGHTSGDIVVAFPGKRVAYLGDLFPGKTVPVVDAAAGGSFVAWPETLARAVTELKGIPKIIPGHSVSPVGSPLGRWITMADLEEYSNFTRDFLAAVQTAFKAGKTVDEAVSSLQLSERYPAYNFDNARAGVQVIYAELNTKR
jgi:glyoxylase-like metal-dependent hydrolase (beta-lactamase superfamily II)